MTCARDRVLRPAPPAGRCTEGASTVVSVHRALRERLPDLASRCERPAEIVIRFALSPEGSAESAEVVSTTAGGPTTERALDLVRGASFCPPGDHRRTIVTYPLELR